MLDVNHVYGPSWLDSFKFIDRKYPMDLSWLGDGTTSKQIVEIIKDVL